MTDPAALARLVDWAAVTGDEVVLDVACGPGLVAAAIAPRVRHVTAIDLTPAMLTRGVEVACEQGAANVAFVCGDVTALPCATDSFDRVISRRAFHHFPEPERVLAEMARVCRPAGAVVIEDQAPPADAGAADAMTTIDRLRDPSHTRAVDPASWPMLFATCGLTLDDIDVRPRELDVDEWMTRAHPPPEDAARARAMLEAAARGEIPGLDARHVDGALRFTIGLQIVRAHPTH
jgi:SAM-dependent methyltransferase